MNLTIRLAGPVGELGIEPCGGSAARDVAISGSGVDGRDRDPVPPMEAGPG